MLALIDESVRVDPYRGGLHYVVSSAVIVDDPAECRKRIVKVIGGRARPFHWSEAGIEKRSAMLSCFAEVALWSLTAIHAPVSAKHQRGARAESMTQVLHRLGVHGVERVLIESRGVQDVDDRVTIQAAQGEGLLPVDFRHDFGTKSEPLLWLPDASAGLWSDAEIGIGNSLLLEAQKAIDLHVVRLGL